MKKPITLSLSLLLTLFASAQSLNEAVVSTRLLKQIAAHPNEHILVYTLLEDRVDVADLGVEFEKDRLPVERRVETLIHTLKAKAENTQPAFIQYLQTVAGIHPASIRSFWITNVIFMEANAEAIAALSRRPELSWIDMNVANAADEFETMDCALAPVPNGREKGLEAINAPALWAMGYTGYGQVAFSADTGIDPFHPAINFKYRGLYADHSETWSSFDQNGNPISNNTPTNCGDHGNHTTGTILGLDRMTNDTIGVAFGANWIGAAILCGVGTEDNIGAFQWALDPDNNPATFEDMPDVINNSWFDPDMDSDQECEGIYKPIITALELAGIANIFSAGNEGPNPGTITVPKNINTDTLNSFTVGALNGNASSLPVADFSSQGPSACGGEGSLLIKPEVSAPGENVRSCELDGTYGTKSGTSMAAPHVAGAVLLLKEAFPYLSGKDLLRAIYHSCTDLGDTGEDNVFGMGIINVLAAYNLLISQGHVPVSPHVVNDALVVGFLGSGSYCLEEQGPILVFENAGTDTLYSLDVSFSLTKTSEPAPIASATVNWTGSLPPKERANFVIPLLNITNGTYLVEVTLDNPNGEADEKPLNNKGFQEFFYYVSESFNVYLGGIEDSLPCIGSNALLYSDYEGDGTIYWYTTANGNTPIGEGNYFTTSNLNFDFTYYAELVSTIYAGETNLHEPTFANDMQTGALIFDAYYDFRLKSVKLYPESPGVRLLQILDASGEVIVSKSLFLFQAGEQRVNLNIPIPKGENMRIKLSGTNSLPYSAEANFPYSIGTDLGLIKTSNHPSAPESTWFYFYDWEVEMPSACGRQAVLVDVVPTNNAPQAQFSSSSDTIDFNNNQPVVFINESISATEWLWSFGDGTTSTEENPSHLYPAEGLYKCVLTVLGPDGCSDSFSKDIVIESTVSGLMDDPELEGALLVYPNPVGDYLHVNYMFREEQKLELKVMDALGRIVYAEAPRAFGIQGQHLIDVNSWSNGIYYLMLRNGKASLGRKVVVLK
jgi:Subtilase family/PKD domain/Secretion system C-terminal sorting domain/Ig-like domain CHU_C associated